MGVVVNEITSEISTATDSVTANSRNSRPVCPPMKSSGINTATSDRLIDSTVKADLACAQQRGLEAVHAGFDVPAGVFQHHDGVVHHKTGGHRQRHQAQVVQAEKPSRYITPKVPSSDTTVATAGMKVARALRKKALTTSTTSAIEISSVISTSLQRGTYRVGAVGRDLQRPHPAAAAPAARAAGRARRRRFQSHWRRAGA